MGRCSAPPALVHWHRAGGGGGGVARAAGRQICAWEWMLHGRGIRKKVFLITPASCPPWAERGGEAPGAGRPAVADRAKPRGWPGARAGGTGSRKRGWGKIQLGRIGRRIAVIAARKRRANGAGRVGGWLGAAIAGSNSCFPRIRLTVRLTGFCAFDPFRKPFKNEFGGHS